MNETEKETLKQLKGFISRLMDETILPPLYEQGYLSPDNMVEIRIRLRPVDRTSEALKRMEIECEEVQTYEE